MNTRNANLAALVDRIGIPLAAALLLAGHFAPWAAHKTAALTLSAHELAVFTHFTPGAGIFLNQWFYLPLWSAALLLALLAGMPGSLANRLLGALGCAILAALGFPSYPAVLTAFRNPDYQLQFFLSLAVIATVAVTVLLRLGHLPRVRLGAWLVLSLISAVPLAGYVMVKPALEQLYQDTLGFGLGWWLTLMAVLSSLASLAILFAQALLRGRMGIASPSR